MSDGHGEVIVHPFDIRRLDVAMDDAFGMRRIEGVRNVGVDVEHRYTFEPFGSFGSFR